MSRKRKKQKTSAKFAIHHVIEDGWVHTHGMDELGLPELEIRNVPSLFVDDAIRLTRFVCAYMQEPGVVMQSGEIMSTSPNTHFQFKASEPITGEEDHFEVARFELVGLNPACEGCHSE